MVRYPGHPVRVDLPPFSKPELFFRAMQAIEIPFSYTIVMDTLLAHITIDPAVCHGKPCVRGLRYQVEILLELLRSGMTIDEILADYKDLERTGLFAVLAFAARLTRTRRNTARTPNIPPPSQPNSPRIGLP